MYRYFFIIFIMATILRPPSIQSIIAPTPTATASTPAPVASTDNTAQRNAERLAAIKAANKAKADAVNANSGYITAEATIDPPTEVKLGWPYYSFTRDWVRYGWIWSTELENLPQATLDKQYRIWASNTTDTNKGTSINLTTPKLEVPKTNVGTVNTDNGNIMDTPKTEDAGGINKEKDYKEGTYMYFIKKLWQTPTQARASVKQFNTKAPTTPTPTSTTEVSTYTPENIYDKAEAMKKDVTEDTKTVVKDVRKLREESALDNFNTKKSLYNDQWVKVTAERDASIKEFEDLVTGYESNRLNQVRGGIMQALAQRGVEIGNLSPEALIQLSGEVGSRAFTDIYNAKESSKAKIQAVRQSALNVLNELASKQWMNQIEYDSAVAELSAAEKTDLNNLDTAFNEFIFGTGEKKVNTDVANKAAATNALYTILTNANVPLEQQSAFNTFLSKPGATAESVLRDLQSNLSPAQRKILEDARTASAAAANVKYDTQIQIQEMKNQAAERKAALVAATARVRSAGKWWAKDLSLSEVNSSLSWIRTAIGNWVYTTSEELSQAKWLEQALVDKQAQILTTRM